VTARKTWRLGRKDRDTSIEPGEDGGKADEEYPREQRPDTDAEGLAERWRASHEEWRRRLRSEVESS
jgi:hypothetical protein